MSNRVPDIRPLRRKRDACGAAASRITFEMESETSGGRGARRAIAENGFRADDGVVVTGLRRNERRGRVRVDTRQRHGWKIVLDRLLHLVLPAAPPIASRSAINGGHVRWRLRCQM